MNCTSAVANIAWLAAGARSVTGFLRALRAPLETQERWLHAQLARHARSAFGEAHDFSGISNAATFSRSVPLSSYDDVVPWIARIQRGERNVLSCDEITHLAPTSGSSGARKLIPFTPGLTRAFDAAIAPWLGDLVRQRPRVLGGPAYWSISPLAASEEPDESPVPVGFADDSEYLGGAKAWLVRQALAVPSTARFVQDESAFWRLSLLALLRCRDLRLMSVWHPSFLELLVGTAETEWAELIDSVESGDNPWLSALPETAREQWRAGPDRRRAADLRAIGRHDWQRWWPKLQVVSCWGEQAAEPGWQRLRARLPDVLVQRKGLLATEAVVTIPVGEVFPLAITSHYFEFLHESGDVRRAHELEPGSRYEVVVTNGGGLWRYRLGDIVECTGHVFRTPTLRFLGRAGLVSDLRGEKLSEAFVAQALRKLWKKGEAPVIAYVRAWDRGTDAGYELVLSSDAAERANDLVRRLESEFQANPHYALARRLGQLARLRVVLTSAATGEALREEARARGARVGDVKPRTLVPAGSSVDTRR